MYDDLRAGTLEQTIVLSSQISLKSKVIFLEMNIAGRTCPIVVSARWSILAQHEYILKTTREIAIL